MPQSPSKSRPPPLSPAQASRRRQRSSFVTGALAGGSAVALLALMALASSRAGSDSGGGAWGSDGSGGSGGEPFSSSSRRFPPSSPDPWVPNSALRASASAQVTAAAVQALRESGALRASKGSSMPWSSAKKTTTAKEAKATKRTKKNKKPSTTTQKHPPRPVLPSSLNGLAALALDGDGGDVEAATVSESSNSQLLPPRASVVVPLLTDREAKGAAATALSAAAAFDNDNVDGDDENSSSSSSSLEIIIVAADAEVARSLTGTSAETQAGVRLIVRDAAAARIAGQRRKEEEEVEEGSEDGSDETDETETSSSSSSSSSSRHFLRRSPPPPLLPPRLPQLGGSGAGDAALRNAGARAARSEDLLVFLKPGVTLRKGYWRALFSSAKAHPKAQFFFSGRQPSPSLTEADSEDWAKRLPWHNPYAFNRAFAIRRRSWVEAGGFSPAAVPGTDVEALLLSALDAPPRIERLDAKGDLVKEENAGPSGKGSIANSGEPHGYLFAVQTSKKRLAGVEGERDEDYYDDENSNSSSKVDDENKAKGSRSPSSPLFSTSLALIAAHHPLPPQHLVRAHAFLEDGISNGGSGGGRDHALARDVLRAASSALASEGCPLSAGGDLLSGLVFSFAENWDEAGRSFQRAGACASSSVARVPSLAWQAGFLNDAVRRNVLEKCVRKSAAALEPGFAQRPRREAAKADAWECVALLVGV